MGDSVTPIDASTGVSGNTNSTSTTAGPPPPAVVTAVPADVASISALNTPEAQAAYNSLAGQIQAAVLNSQ